MYSARDEREHAEWIGVIEQVTEELELVPEARSVAVDLFLSAVPEQDRSKRAAVAASVYAASLIAGDERPQTAVADAADVSRITVQNKWRERLAAAGMEAPSW